MKVMVFSVDKEEVQSVKVSSNVLEVPPVNGAPEKIFFQSSQFETSV